MQLIKSDPNPIDKLKEPYEVNKQTNKQINKQINK